MKTTQPTTIIIMAQCVHGRETKDLIPETDNSPNFVIGRDASGTRWKGTGTCVHGDPDRDGYITYGANHWEMIW